MTYKERVWQIVDVAQPGDRLSHAFDIFLMGKIIAGIISILGIGMVALPAGIISAGFVDELSNKQQDTVNSGKEHE